MFVELIIPVNPAARIFPSQTDNVSKDLYGAAWETYITFCNIYDNVYEILKEDKIGPKIGKELKTDALYAVFFFMSIMFPTIFALGIKDLRGESMKSFASFCR